MGNKKRQVTKLENPEDIQGNQSLRIKSLQKALSYYRDISIQQNDEIVALMKRLSSLEEEKESRIRALEAQQQLMAAQLEEKDRQLKEALVAKNLSERKYGQLKVLSDKMRADRDLQGFVKRGDLSRECRRFFKWDLV